MQAFGFGLWYIHEDYTNVTLTRFCNCHFLYGRGRVQMVASNLHVEMDEPWHSIRSKHLRIFHHFQICTLITFSSCWGAGAGGGFAPPDPPNGGLRPAVVGEIYSSSGKFVLHFFEPPGEPGSRGWGNHRGAAGGTVKADLHCRSFNTWVRTLLGKPS